MSRCSSWLAMGGAAVSIGTLGFAWASVPPPHPFAADEVTGGTGVDCLTFMPDGDTALLDVESSHGSTIAISHRTAGAWSMPRTASFSGRWVDHDPVVAPDGSYLIFTSNRPDVAGGQALHGGHLWRVDRSGRDWSTPSRLPGNVNFGEHVYAPGIAANGDLFFQSRDNPSHDYHIYLAAWHDGHYRNPVQLPLGPAAAHELDPAIAPDESFIVFDANYAGRREPDHLYIAFAQGDQWSTPTDLGDALDRYEPWGSHLGPDGHTLYVTSDAVIASTRSGTRAAVNVANRSTTGGVNHIWSMDLAPSLRASSAAAAGTPKIFAPGVISGPLDDASPAFTPDGRTVYFVRSDQSSTLMASHLENGSWSTPQSVPFSGHWRDVDPAMAPDGSYLLFVSNRPVTRGGKRLELVYEGKVYPTGMNIWRVDRTAEGWSKPVRLPPAINTSTFTFAPSIATDNTLYYVGQTSPGQRRLLRARYRQGRYLQPEIVRIGGPSDWIRDPAIAPDQSFIVFSIIPAGSKQSPRLAIAFRRGPGWSRPIDLGDSVNGGGSHAMGSQLGPDHHALYFYSDRKLSAAPADSWNDGKDNIWTIDLTPWLERAPRPGATAATRL